MSRNLCPNCLVLVSEEERLSGQCPHCKSFFESEIPTSTMSAPVINAPAAQRAPRIEVGSTDDRTRRSDNSGLWSAWWMIPVALLGVRGCMAVARYDRPETPTYDYRPHDFEMRPPSEFNQEEIRRMIERINEQQEIEVDPFLESDADVPDRFPPLNVPPGYEPPTQPNLQPEIPRPEIPQPNIRRPLIPQPVVPQPDVRRPQVPQPIVPQPNVQRPGFPAGPQPPTRPGLP